MATRDGEPTLSDSYYERTYENPSHMIDGYRHEHEHPPTLTDEPSTNGDDYELLKVNPPFKAEPNGLNARWCKVKTLHETPLGGKALLVANQRLQDGLGLPPLFVVEKDAKSDISLQSQRGLCAELARFANGGWRDNDYVRVYHGAFQDDDSVYLVLEYCAGGDLVTAIQCGGLFQAPHERRDIAKQMLEAFGSLHRKGITYPDLRPEDFLLSQDNQVKLSGVVSFGRARSYADSPTKVVPKDVDAIARDACTYAMRATTQEKIEAMQRIHGESLKQLGYAAERWIESRAGAFGHQIVELFKQNAETDEATYDTLCIMCQKFVEQRAADPAQTKAADVLRVGKAMFAVVYGISVLSAGRVSALCLDPDAKDFFLKVLNPDPTLRPSIDSALAHPWLSQHAAIAANASSTEASAALPSEEMLDMARL